MGNPASIRKATLLDLMPLAKMSETYISEVTTMCNNPISIPTLMRNLAASIVVDDAYVKVMELDGKMIGGMWGVLTTLPWSDTPIAQDVIIFVHKSHRGLGNKFIEDWVTWSTSKGAKEVLLSTASGITTDRFIKLMGLKGFKPQGYSFVKEINNVNE